MPRKLHEIVYKVDAKREQGKPVKVREGGGGNFGATESTVAEGMVFRERKKTKTDKPRMLEANVRP